MAQPALFSSTFTLVRVALDAARPGTSEPVKPEFGGSGGGSLASGHAGKKTVQSRPLVRPNGRNMSITLLLKTMYIGATLGSNLIEEIVLELKRETGSERKAVFEQIDFHIFRQ